MLFKTFADFVILVHFFWIIFLISGALWGVRNKLIRAVHLCGLSFAIVMQVFGWYCPLTHLEIWLRSQHNPGLNYSGSFIIHYLERIVYWEISQTAIFFFTILFSVFNSWFYFKKRERSAFDHL